MKNFDYEIPIERVAGYLGQKSLTAEFVSLYEQTKTEVLAEAMPKQFCVVCQAEKKEGFYHLADLDITLKSQEVNRFFNSCEKIAALAVTIGEVIDKKIAFYQRTDILKSACFDACSSVLVEIVSERLKEDLRAQYPNYFLTMSYSAGYGDLGLELQKEIIEKLQLAKRIGIRTNKECLMIPLKSITAFVGLSKEKQILGDTCVACQNKGKCSVECNRVKI